MIGAIVRVGLINLRRDGVAQAMTFVLPLAFFSLFALVFGQQSRGEIRPIKTAVVDLDQSESSKALVAALQKEKGLRIVLTARPKGARAGTPEQPLDRTRAEEIVRDGTVAAALVFPAGYGDGAFSFDPKAPAVEMMVDVSDPVAAPMVEGLLQKTAFTAAPEAVIRKGLDQFDRFAGGMTPSQRAAVDQWLPTLHKGKETAKGDGTDGGFGGIVAVKRFDLLGAAKDNSLVSFYAAGIGVMFLLFSCTAAGGSIIEESESGTLERVLTSKLGMGRLLIGKWLYIWLLGITQVTVMFVWGAVAFKLDLVHHLAGFAVMTLVTAGAAAGFGLVLATACRTRAQLSGISTIVILMMSALGGSMFPRFLMSETMQKLGLLTFNGWALDGYIKVFWREAAITDLGPQVGVLIAATVVFLGVARLLARRWETV